MAKSPTKVVYIAGPYRAATEWGVAENIRSAERRAVRVWELGMVALCPQKNTAFLGGLLDDRIFLDGDLELLRRSDAVILVDGWVHSDGAVDEVLHAIDRGIPVFESLISLSVWKYHGTVVEVQEKLKAKALQSRETRRAQAGPRAGQGGQE